MNLSGTLVKMRSIREDLEGHLSLERVGLSINLVRFKESEIDFRLSDFGLNQSKFRSPTKMNLNSGYGYAEKRRLRCWLRVVCNSP